ncbi:MAG: sugar ABC transporter permease [Bauldia sp.]|nr:sugar ABC transporter permease [Bauldia sp.]
MVGAIAVIWIAFHMLSAWRLGSGPFDWDAGAFLTPRNLWNLSVQFSSIAVMATGMVLVIVTRNIDLSVGSVLGFVGMLMAFTQVRLLPEWLELGHWSIWIISVLVGIVAGAIIGGLHGFIIAFLGVPAFITTLGGLLIWRGAAWWVTSGQTIAPMDPTYRLIGGGPSGALGANLTWAVGLLACGLIAGALFMARRQRLRFKFTPRPVWAEVTLAVIGCAIVIGVVLVVNNYPWPVNIARNYAAQNGIEWPEEGSLFIPHGLAYPVLIALSVAVAMTFIARRTRFGRYVFAIGGNPEAANLAGINTKWVTMKVFMLMGALIGISSSIATARLNAATNNTGTLDELYTIAAAVIGGTSLGGGVGTIAGALLGALLMQSLQSGMVLMGLETPIQQIVVGVVLVLAVMIDTYYRRRTA